MNTTIMQLMIKRFSYITQAASTLFAIGSSVSKSVSQSEQVTN